MAFVRYKVVKGRKYYQYVRNYREGGGTNKRYCAIEASTIP
jgi:hypothetical protein